MFSPVNLLTKVFHPGSQDRLERREGREERNEREHYDEVIRLLEALAHHRGEGRGKVEDRVRGEEEGRRRGEGGSNTSSSSCHSSRERGRSSERGLASRFSSASLGRSPLPPLPPGPKQASLPSFLAKEAALPPPDSQGRRDMTPCACKDCLVRTTTTLAFCYNYIAIILSSSRTQLKRNQMTHLK